ncbi:hypothetical protein ACIREM_09875 [Streptomyces shenzhenensis]|uniref:hypothetical protein n=1 Tax=Streptomyces shenzhenensis TaxID=943815 RepID=UPI00380829F9
MTAPNSLPLHALAEDNLAAASPELLRAMVKTFADALMSAAADVLYNAEYGQVSDAAFADAAIAARTANPDRPGLDEEDKGWVEAEFHEGTDSPSVNFQRECMDRATAVAGPLGYELRSYGVVVAAAAQLRHIVDSRTGGLVMKSFGDMSDKAMAIISEQFGIPVEFLEVKEPPGMWDLAEA